MQSLVLALSAGKGGKSYHFALNSDWLKVSWGTGEFGVHSLAKELPTFFSRPSIKSCTKLINTCVVAKFKKQATLGHNREVMGRSTAKAEYVS